MQQTQAERKTKPGVLLVLPEWGGAKGGAYSTARSVIHYLRRSGRAIYCMLGNTVDEISLGDRQHITELGVNIVEPNLRAELGRKSPQDRVQDILFFDDYYRSRLDVLKNCDKIISFHKSTRELVLYIADSTEANNYELVTIINGFQEHKEEGTELADLVRTSKVVFSAGGRIFRSVNSILKVLQANLNNNLLIPDLTISDQRSPPGKEKKMERERKKMERIFLPWGCSSGLPFLQYSISVVNAINRGTKPHMKALIQIQPYMQVKDDYSAQGSKIVQDDENLETVICTSLEDVLNTAMSSTLVIANGNFTETGFSGLEFLMNGYITLVPENTDVAEILMNASPTHARSFILKFGKGVPTGPQEEVINDWKENIWTAMNRRGLLLRNIMILKESIQCQRSFMESQSMLIDALTCSVSEEIKIKRPHVIDITHCLTGNNLLGVGAWGNVYKLDEKRAVKVIRMATTSSSKTVEREKKAYDQLTNKAPNDNVIELYSIREIEQCLYIVMERAIESMAQYLGHRKYEKLSPFEKLLVLKQIFSGLEHLHTNLIVHQDIKPSNILFVNALHVKLSDFGTARIKSEKHTTEGTGSNPGTPFYQAPEVHNEGKRAQPYSDIWSSSLVGVEWFTGSKPWKMRGPECYVYMTEQQKLPRLLSKIPDDVRYILTAGMSYDTKERPPAAYMKDTLFVLAEQNTRKQHASAEQHTRKARVTKTRICVRPSEISLAEGQAVSLVEDMQHGWWKVKQGDKTGLFPAWLLEEITKSGEHMWKARAKHTRVSLESGELSLEAGEIVLVIAEKTDGWLQVKLGNQIGLVPANVLQAIHEKTDERPPALPPRKPTQQNSQRSKSSIENPYIDVSVLPASGIKTDSPRVQIQDEKASKLKKVLLHILTPLKEVVAVKGGTAKFCFTLNVSGIDVEWFFQDSRTNTITKITQGSQYNITDNEYDHLLHIHGVVNDGFVGVKIKGQDEYLDLATLTVSELKRR